jgi:hypothetical protein
MNKRFPYPFAFLLLVLALSLNVQSCKTAKKKTAAPETAESADFLLEKLAANQVDADWFSAKAKIRYEDQNQSVSVSSTIRLKKDSILWMNVKKLGFEVARMLITTDSIFIINRFEQSYAAADLQWVQRNYNLPANLNILQSILLGNPVFFARRNWTTSVEDMYYALQTSDDYQENRYLLTADEFLLFEMALLDKREDREVSLSYDDYASVADDQKFSYLRKLRLKSRETGDVKVDLEFSKVEINVPKSIRFEIPKRYTLVRY